MCIMIFEVKVQTMLRNRMFMTIMMILMDDTAKKIPCAVVVLTISRLIEFPKMDILNKTYHSFTILAPCSKYHFQ